MGAPISPTPIVIGLGADVPQELEHHGECVIGQRAIVAHGCRLGRRVVIGPHATVLAPGGNGSTGGELWIRDNVDIGAGAIVCGAHTIGVGAKVEPGAVVLADVPPYAIVAGNPGQVVGYSAPPGADGLAAPPQVISPPTSPGSCQAIAASRVIRFPVVEDLRGKLTFGESGGLVPFTVKRHFIVYGVPSISVRGEHAHRTLHELLICTAGRVTVSLTDGTRRVEVTLDDPSVGLYIPPLIWSTQYRYSAEASMLVLCSDGYDASSYVRDFDEFLELVACRP